MANANRTYIARKSCGCLTMAVIASSPIAAKEVAKAIRLGETIENIRADQLPDVSDWYCSEHPPKVTPAKK
jgi:hypothetical protein